MFFIASTRHWRGGRTRVGGAFACSITATAMVTVAANALASSAPLGNETTTVAPSIAPQSTQARNASCTVSRRPAFSA
eukprot:964895-Lingulodinium_polyedra.AAC.1